MPKQLHKNFTDGQSKSFLKSYLDKKVKINYILQMLKIKRRRFFELLAKYRKDPDNFSIQYERKTINRKIDPDIEKNIIKGLNTEKDFGARLHKFTKSYFCYCCIVFLPKRFFLEN